MLESIYMRCFENGVPARTTYSLEPDVLRDRALPFYLLKRFLFPLYRLAIKQINETKAFRFDCLAILERLFD